MKNFAAGEKVEILRDTLVATRWELAEYRHRDTEMRGCITSSF